MLARLGQACLIAVLLGAAALAVAAAPAARVPKLKSDIPPQSLAAAMEKFHEDTGLQYVTKVDLNRRSGGAKAGSRPAAALRSLLKNSCLAFEFQTERLVNIFDAPNGRNCPPAAPTDAQAIEEVTVTATRRPQHEDRIPIDVKVVTAADIANSGIKTLTEVAELTPGVEFDYYSTVGSGVYTNLAIRGITDRHGSDAGVFIGDVPEPTVRSNAVGRALPSAFDLERIEVERGPQGTILGANTQGGAVRFIPRDPSLSADSGLVHSEVAFGEQGEPTYEAGAASGGPLQEGLLGYRISAWYRSVGGDVSRISPFDGTTVDANSDRTSSKSARVAVKYSPVDTVELTPRVDYESTSARDSPAFFTYLSDPAAGRLNNGSLFRQPANDAYTLATLRFKYASSNNTEVSTQTAYFDRSGNLLDDDTQSLRWGGWNNAQGAAYPSAYDNAVMTSISLTQRRFSQEARIGTTDADGKRTWVATLFYSYERYREADELTTHVVPNVPLLDHIDNRDYSTITNRTYAALGDVTQEFGKGFGLAAGLRVERNAYQASSIQFPQQLSHAATVFVPRLSLTYSTGEHRQNYYASVAKGYAPAGVDAALASCFQPPEAYPADSVWSYELGTKDALLPGRWHLDATVFHARWNNGPAATVNCLFTHIPGTAVSNGFDLATHGAFDAQDQWDARLELSYTDAHYTQDSQSSIAVLFPSGIQYYQLIVKSGDAVGTPPLVTSPWNVTASLRRRIALSDDTTLDIRGEDSFHSHNPGPFFTQNPAAVGFYAPGVQSNPATNLLNLRAILRRDELEMALFVNNVLDSQPTLSKRNKGVDVNSLYFATTLPPRTYGVSATWYFSGPPGG